MESKITIIILIFEEKIEVIFKCLKLLRDFEIILIDNSNNLERKKKISKNFNISKYFLNKKNLGFSKAVNIAIKNCNTEYLLILNPDCLITKDEIMKLYKSIIKYDNCVITTPTLITKENKIAQNASLFPESGALRTPFKTDGDLCCQSILAAAMFCKTSELIKIGLFDEKFFLFYEDDDLCRRIYNKKKSIIQVYDAVAIHQHGEGESISNFLKKTFIINFNMTYSELLYFYKINKHQQKYNNLKKKIPNYIFKFILNLILIRLNKSIYFFSKILAFLKFKSLLKKN